MEIIKENCRNLGVGIDFVKLKLRMSFHRKSKSHLSKACFLIPTFLYSYILFLHLIALNKLTFVSTGNFIIIIYQCKAGVTSA